jgi:hypothetical protein
MRMAIDSEMGLPADEYFNFRPHLQNTELAMHCGMFCVLEEYRSTRLTTGLLLMSTYFAFANGINKVLAPINPALAKLLMRIGFEQAGELFIEKHIHQEVLPLFLDLTTLNDYFLNFAKSNSLEGFLHDYERWFFDKGETIIKTGEEGEEAFLIISGEAEVRLQNQEEAIATLKEGEVFGELALLIDTKRTAEVIAKTDIQLMRLPKKMFLKRFLQRPEEALKLIQLMGKRTRDILHKLEQSD